MTLTVKKTAKSRRKKSGVKQDNAIKSTLTKINMSAQELADLCETNKGHMSRIINGKNKHISVAMALKIASVLGKKVEELFELEK